MRLSPLLAAAVALAGGAWAAFWPAGIVLASAVAAGRLFCGWACPVGALVDLGDAALGTVPALRRRAARGGAVARSTLPMANAAVLRSANVAVAVLGAVLAAAAVGVGLAGWVDPMPIAVRTVAEVALPAADAALRAAGAAPLVGGVPRRIEERVRGWILPVEPLPLSGAPPVLALLLAVLGLSLAGSRGWCRFVCPLGALLGLAGRAAPVRRRADPALCTRCGVCVPRCPARAIAGDGLTAAAAECLLCGACDEICPRRAVRYLPRAAAGAAVAETKPDVLRRALLFGGAGLVAGAVATPRPAAAARASSRLIRPPGARRERDFLAACVRCGECAKVCPTSGLRPALSLLDVGGVAALWTPTLVPRIGGCEFTCNDCGKVCPSGAIGRLSLEEKQRTVIGRAVIDRRRCLPWAEGESCVVCEEFCPTPTKAIELREEEVRTEAGATRRILAPRVLREVCIGCGLCERYCPVEGAAAIRIVSVGPRQEQAEG